MVYGDISPRTAAFASKDLLVRGLPLLTLEKFGQMKPLPANNTKSMSFRRYEALALATTPLTEGVTPVSKKLTPTDVSVTLEQYGDVVGLTDVILDTHEDPILRETTEILGEQAAQTIETIRYNVLKAGTNKFYATGAARAAVNSPLTATLQKKIVRGLKRQNAQMISKVIKSTPDFNTEAVLASYVGLTHTDVEGDIRAMDGFIDAKDYGHGVTPWEGEIGSVQNVRYILSNIFVPYDDAGGLAATNGTVTTSGTSSNVYPVIYLGKDAWAGVALKGKFAITPMVVNPKPSESDPLGQRGTVAWKTMQQAIILNDAFMAVAEVAATDL